MESERGHYVSAWRERRGRNAALSTGNSLLEEGKESVLAVRVLCVCVYRRVERRHGAEQGSDGGTNTHKHMHNVCIELYPSRHSKARGRTGLATCT